MPDREQPRGVTQRGAVRALLSLLAGEDVNDSKAEGARTAPRSVAPPTNPSESQRTGAPPPKTEAPRRKPGDPGDPWLSGAGRFLLEVDGVPIGRFTEVQGLNVEIGLEKIEEGGQNHFVHQRPGRMSWPNITLKRGIVVDDNLFEWFSKTSGDGYIAANNTLKLHTAAITVISPKGQRMRSWNVERAFPVKWNGPSFTVGSTDVPTEELEIAHHGFSARNL